MDNQSDIHAYDNFINPRRHSYNRYNFRPQPRKDYRLFLGEKDMISLSSKILLKYGIQKEIHTKKVLKERKSLKLNAKINEIYFTNENKRKKS